MTKPSDDPMKLPPEEFGKHLADKAGDQLREAVKGFFQAMADNKCPHCGADVVNKRQVGRCVYADPCGHRLYQGRLNPSAHPDGEE